MNGNSENQTAKSNTVRPDGVIVIDKPCNMTSHDVVNRIRRLYNTKKVGHTGTLDPMATGVLTVLVGRAAKAAEYLVSDEKRYEATLRLGITTDTADTEGTVLTECDELPCERSVYSAIADFVGKYDQVPPMYSALKRDGVKLVDLARRGMTIEREARPVEIFSIDAERKSKNEYRLNVHCSKGTYIRTLCEDIGAKLGCGGCMSGLRRTQSGIFNIDGAHTLDELEALDPDERMSLLMPTESLFSDLPRITLNPFFSHLAHSGQEIYQRKIGTSLPDGSFARLCDENGFFALAKAIEYENGSALKPIKQFVL